MSKGDYTMTDRQHSTMTGKPGRQPEEVKP